MIKAEQIAGRVASNVKEMEKAITAQSKVIDPALSANYIHLQDLLIKLQFLDGKLARVRRKHPEGIPSPDLLEFTSEANACVVQYVDQLVKDRENATSNLMSLLSSSDNDRR